MSSEAEMVKETISEAPAAVPKTKSMSIIVTKGSLDWAYPPFILATTAAAMGLPVSMFFTFYDATAHRRLKKRDFRRLWITRISAAAKLNGTSYSKFVASLKKSGIALDRKILADLAVADPGGFKAVLTAARG